MNVQKYLDLFEYKKREPEDPTSGFWCFTLKAVDTGFDESGEYIAMSDLIRESDLDEDSAYKFTIEALEAIKEIFNGTEEVGDRMEELVSAYSEVPIYNSELTGWLAKGSNWSLVDDYVQEMSNEIIPDSFSIIGLIQGAYSMAWENHYFKVLEAIKE